jgi:hypothetical protein
MGELALESEESSRPAGILRYRWHGIALAVAIFSSLTVFEVDLVSILGLDVLLGAYGGDARFSPLYVVARIALNAAVGVAYGLFTAYTFKSRSVATKLSFAIAKPKSTDTAPLDLVIGHLNERVEILQGRATQIYWTIIVILVAGVFLIIFSGYLSSLDSKLSALWTRISTERETAASEYSKATFALSKEGRVDIVGEARFKTANDNYSKVLDALIEQANKSNGSSNGELLSGGTVLRVGIVGLLIFLTQILISLYRYNSRLITFYVARRDALTLSMGDEQKFKRFAEIFLPRQLDFGREPKHPFHEAAELLRQAGPALGKVKRVSKKDTSAGAGISGNGVEQG